MSLVVVFGATGSQGGSVVKRLLANPKYKVRAVTRNPDSDAAKKLAAQGAEIYTADINSPPETLSPAFADATAAFIVTAYWPSVPTLGLDGAGREELQQFKNLALAALPHIHTSPSSPSNPSSPGSGTGTLKNYIISTLPPCNAISSGTHPVPHFDYKASAARWMAQHTPSLWSITTEFWTGAYASNFAQHLPFFRFLPLPLPQSGSGSNPKKYLLALPSNRDAKLNIAGDLHHNMGVIVEAILNSGPKAHGKVALLVTDVLSYAEVCRVFERTTGAGGGGDKKRAVAAAYAELTDEDAVRIWGEDGGTEMAATLRWSEVYPVWSDYIEDGRRITFAELGVDEEKDLVGFEEAMVRMHSRGELV